MLTCVLGVLIGTDSGYGATVWGSSQERGGLRLRIFIPKGEGKGVEYTTVLMWHIFTSVFLVMVVIIRVEDGWNVNRGICIA